MNANFKVKTESTEGLETVEVAGELDEATATELRTALEQAMARMDRAVLVDLSSCEFIDSTGLSLLVEGQRKLAESDRAFAICCPRSEVSRLLELTGIDSTISLFETREEAVSSLSEPAGS
ncbi:MAG TPA: STAS domain-containing protein [Solirubrobacterales bacterium]|nr:STAS domain-containing protein [Solirubrobacterales bacterium]